MAVVGEGVGDAGSLGLDQFLLERVVETLKVTCQYIAMLRGAQRGRTGPVSVLLLFVLQVPCRFGADVCCAATSVEAATAAAREYRILLSSSQKSRFSPLEVVGAVESA